MCDKGTVDGKVHIQSAHSLMQKFINVEILRLDIIWFVINYIALKLIQQKQWNHKLYGLKINGDNVGMVKFIVFKIKWWKKKVKKVIMSFRFWESINENIITMELPYVVLIRLI